MSNKVEEYIQFTQRLRAEGLTWAETFEKFEEKYPGERTNARSLERWYQRLDIDLELSDQVGSIKLKRRAQNTARVANRRSNVLADNLNLLDDVLEELQKTLRETPLEIKKYSVRKNRKGTPMICEALLGDLQIGKLSPDFNLEIAEKRLDKYGKSLMFKLEQHMKNGYKIDKIILALLGDIIESLDKAAKKGSPLSVEVSTPEQIVLATRYIFEKVIAPIAELGFEMEIIGVPGNHDGVDNGMIQDKAGKQLYTWVIYKTLQYYCEMRKYNNVKFNITEGVYASTEIYGHTAVYEHGYGISVSESNLLNRSNQRGRQLKKHVTYFRMGDKHNITRFNEDQQVVNGAFFGMALGDMGHEYSSAQGYCSPAGQVVFFHVERDDERLPCYDSFVIQLGHVK